VATVEDLDAIVVMGTEFIQSTAYEAVLPIHPGPMAACVARLIDAPDGAVFVSEADGQLTGMIGLVAYAHHISGERVAGEVFLFVRPKARGRTGLDLIRHAEQWARAQGAIRLELIAPSDRTGALYARLGYAPMERTYHRSLHAA
jgi:GNAT superfamily N-acetyltransferase